MKEPINCLPAPTWNHIGVNWAAEEFSLPTPPESGWGQSPTEVSPLPVGVRRLDAPPPACAAIESGMGQAADRAVAQSANSTCFLAVEGAVERPVLITHTLDEAHPAAVAHQAIYVSPDSSLTLVQVCRSSQETAGIAASLTQVYAGAGACVRLVQIQLLGGRSRGWSAVGVHAETGARTELVRVVLGGAASLWSSRAALAGRASRYELSTAYLGAGEQALDFNDTAVHIGRETESELHSAGVLSGRSRKILRGTIDFRRGALRAVGHESEDVLLFSPQARSRTAPLILCGEEQVEGQHAATAGRLDERMLYYLTSRGLSPAQARRMMVEARFAPALGRIPDDSLREEILTDVERRLDGHA